MKKILKTKKGFTLVELIVVIAILGVLAVIMVPAFTGYVSKAKDSSANADAKAWCTAYQAAYADLAGDLGSGDTAISTAMSALNVTFTKKEYIGGSMKYVVNPNSTNGSCAVTTAAK